MVQRIKVMLGRGTGLPFDSGFVWDVANMLDPDIFVPVENKYRAEIRPIGMLTMGEAEFDFRQHADKMNLGEFGMWMGLGYSLGACALHRYVSTHKLTKCKGIGLIADGYRHPTQFTGGTRPKPAGWGLAGRWVVGRNDYPVWTMSAPNDPISECPGDNGLRVLANVATPQQQPIPSQVANIGYTMQWLGYYAGTRHTCYGSEKFPGSTLTYTQEMARLMNEEGLRLQK